MNISCYPKYQLRFTLQHMLPLSLITCMHASSTNLYIVTNPSMVPSQYRRHKGAASVTWRWWFELTRRSRDCSWERRQKRSAVGGRRSSDKEAIGSKFWCQRRIVQIGWLSCAMEEEVEDKVRVKGVTSPHLLSFSHANTFLIQRRKRDAIQQHRSEWHASCLMHFPLEPQLDSNQFHC